MFHQQRVWRQALRLEYSSPVTSARRYSAFFVGRGTPMPRSFLDDHRWDLCKSFLERADRSADVSRSLLFTASAAGTGFSILQMGDGSRYHLVAAALFAFAVAVLYLSWDRQKLKARERFRLLRDEGVAAYVENEKKCPAIDAWTGWPFAHWSSQLSSRVFWPTSISSVSNVSL
jgi:hypothetical protein